ncbi:hypothetical protein ACM66B_004127 [Microbotryomycetes sp. NB124-2]
MTAPAPAAPQPVTRTRSRSFSTADLPPVPSSTTSMPIPLHSPPLNASVTSPILSPASSSLSASLKAFADLSLSPPTTLDSAEFQRAFHHARRSSFNGSKPSAVTNNDKDAVATQSLFGGGAGAGVPPMSSSPTSSTVSDTLPTPPSSSPPKSNLPSSRSAVGIKVPAARQVKPSQLDGVCEKEELSLDDDATTIAASAPASNAMFANGARWGWPQSATGPGETTVIGPTSPVLSSSPPGPRSAAPIRRASLSATTSTSANLPPMAPLGRVVSAGSGAGNGSTTASGTGGGSKAADGFGLFRRLSVGGFGSRPKPPSPPASTFGGNSNPFGNSTTSAPAPAPSAPAPAVAGGDDGARGRKNLTTTASGGGSRPKRRVSPFGERMLRDLGH